MSHATPALPPAPPCPRCGAAHVVRNGRRHEGVPSFLCRACGRQFVRSPRRGPVAEGTKALVLRLLGERLAIRAIARVTGLSRSWLQRFVNALYREQTPHDPGPLPKKVATW
jgi:transposase-like protein